MLKRCQNQKLFALAAGGGTFQSFLRVNSRLTFSAAGFFGGSPMFNHMRRRRQGRKVSQTVDRLWRRKLLFVACGAGEKNHSLIFYLNFVCNVSSFLWDIWIFFLYGVEIPLDKLITLFTPPPFNLPSEKLNWLADILSSISHSPPDKYIGTIGSLNVIVQECSFSIEYIFNLTFDRLVLCLVVFST